MVAISVVMPVFNRAETVRRAIESVLSQEFADFELIIVDDGSSDTTVDVIRSVADTRIRLLIQARNMGGNAARNRGIGEARAPIVSFLDSDDVFLRGKLKRITSFFARNPHVDAVIDSFELQFPPERNGRKVLRQNPELMSSAAVEEATYARTLFKATPAISARKAALEKIGMFDETLKRRQDMDMVLRLAAATNVQSIPDVLWTKHWTPGAISSKQNTFIAAVLDICDRHPSYMSETRFRCGLARDFARHFLRLALRCRLTAMREDWRLFALRHGAAEARRLFSEGIWEMIVRAFKRL
jgi:glycosyltransferase involved in cell wall biosynthesis